MLAVAALLLTAACGSSEPSHGCKVPAPCDITQVECERAVLELTACMRQDPLPSAPPLRVITQDQYRKELQAQAKKQGSTPTPWDTALGVLQLAPELTSASGGSAAMDAAIEATVASVSAYYDDHTKNITVIKPTMPEDQLSQMYVLSHELTHYLQDRSRDLGALGKQYSATLDEHVSFVTLVEGDAVVSSTRVLSLLHGHTPEELRWNAFIDSFQQQILMDIAESSVPLFSAHENLPYPIGSRYIADLWNSYDREHVEALFDDPPRHLVDWMSGSRGGEVTASLIEPLSCAPPSAPAGFVIYGEDSWGATGLLALLLHMKLTTSSRDQLVSLAGQLRNDRIAVYAQSKAKGAPLSPVLVAWRLRFDSTGACDSFASAIAFDVPAKLQLTVASSRELLITASDTATISWPDSSLSECRKPLSMPATPASSSPMADRRPAGFAMLGAHGARARRAHQAPTRRRWW